MGRGQERADDQCMNTWTSVPPAPEFWHAPDATEIRPAPSPPIGAWIVLALLATLTLGIGIASIFTPAPASCDLDTPDATTWAEVVECGGVSGFLIAGIGVNLVLLAGGVVLARREPAVTMAVGAVAIVLTLLGIGSLWGLTALTEGMSGLSM